MTDIYEHHVKMGRGWVDFEQEIEKIIVQLDSYNVAYEDPVCYVHGECRNFLYKDDAPYDECCTGDGNIVLGINEYLSREEQNQKTDFALF